MPKNYSCQQIEQIVEGVEGVETGFSAACAIRNTNSVTDELAVFFNTSFENMDLVGLVNQIRRALVNQLGINPTYIVPLSKEKIPRTSFGKIKRIQLAQKLQSGEFDTIIQLLAQKVSSYQELHQEKINQFRAPRNVTEEILVNIWAEVFQLEQVGIDDNFFDLGGNSLSAIRMYAQIEKAFKFKEPLKALFQLSTIAELAVALSSNKEESEQSKLATNSILLMYDDERIDNSPRLSSAEQSWLLSSTITKKELWVPYSLIMFEQAGEDHSGQPLFFVSLLGELGKYFSKNQRVYNLTIWTKVEQPATFIKALAAYYVKEIRLIQPTGPYFLGGYCNGGIVALEIAQQLQELGQTVAWLGLIQTKSPDFLYNHYQPLLLGLGYRFFLRLVTRWRNLTTPDALTKSQPDKDRFNKNSQPDNSEEEIISTLRQARQQYLPKPYNGKVTLFFAAEGELNFFAFS